MGADGIKSVIRKQFYPDEGEPRYSGYTIWRGVLPYKPFLSGANTIRAGWMPVGKIMVYPIRNNIDDEGNQLMNWVVTQERPRPKVLDWNKPREDRGFLRALPQLAFRLAGRARHAAEDRASADLPDGRPRSAADLDLRACDASGGTPRIRCIRAGRTGQGSRSSTPAS